MALKVGIVGAGGVGKALGKQIAKIYPVTYGVRDTSKYGDLAKLSNTSVGTVPEVIKAADVVILATPSYHTEADIKAVADSLGPDIKGKVLIDATNPLTAYPGLEVCWDGRAGGEVLAEALPGTFVYKGWNTVGVMHMEKPDGSLITGQQLTVLVAGGPEHLDQVEAVVKASGFIPQYVGPIRYARNLEAMAELWIHLSVPGVGTTTQKWGFNHHFQVIRAPQ